MSRSKRILLISNYTMGPGGINVQVRTLYDFLKKEGCLVDIYSTQGSFFSRCIKILCLMYVARKYDILHVHASSNRGFMPAVVGILAGRLHYKRVILTYHGGNAAVFLKKHSLFVCFVMNKADVITVPSAFLQKVFSIYGVKTLILANIVNMEKMPIRHRSYLAPHYISVRHLRPLYNIECILRAYRKVKQEIPLATLTLLGDGESRAILEQYVDKNHIEDVHFVGNVDSKQVYEYLLKNDVFISAARKDNMPVSILEAFNAETLVIAANVGGIPYLVENGKTGYLFESDNDKELADLMIEATKNTKSLQIIRNAKDEIDHYQWSNIREKLFAVYQYE